MKKWTIGKRIITGGAVLIALLFVVAGVASSALANLERFAGNRLRDDAIPGIIYASDMTAFAMRGYIRAIVAGGAADAKTRQDNIESSKANIARVTEAMAKYEAAIGNEEDRRNFEELKQKRDVYSKAREAFFALMQSAKPEEISAFAHEKLDPAFGDYRDHMAMMMKWNQDIAKSVSIQMVDTSHRARMTALVVSAASGLLAVALGWMIIRGTNRALRQIATSLNDASSQVAAASGQVSASSQSLAEGASKQAASLEETSSSLEEISSMTRRNADSAENARSIANETAHATEAGTQQMGEMVEAMGAIKTSSDNIAKIIKTIDEIAFQTNILALNAA
ncbi:MAG TPA: MCP four helix bundle domain-containing protein, partial [Rariglobus sp.]